MFAFAVRKQVSLENLIREWVAYQAVVQIPKTIDDLLYPSTRKLSTFSRSRLEFLFERSNEEL